MKLVIGSNQDSFHGEIYMRLIATLTFPFNPSPLDLNYFHGLVVAHCGREALRSTLKFEWRFLFLLIKTEQWTRDSTIRTPHSAKMLLNLCWEGAFWCSGWKPAHLEVLPILSRGIASWLMVWFQEVRSWRRPLLSKKMRHGAICWQEGNHIYWYIEMVHFSDW